MHQRTSRFLVQGFRPTSTPLKLWLLGLIGLGAICSLLFPSNTLAAPTAEWTTPWIFALGPSTAIATGNGATATNTEDFGNIGSSGEALPGTGADAKSMSSASVSTFPASVAMASTSVSFNRSFSLNGSPGGWDLSFNGVLTGDLSTTGRPLNPEASAIANAGISGAGSLSSPSVNILNESLQASLKDSLDSLAPVSNHFSATGLVGDGTYDVSGSLTTSASVMGLLNTFTTGSAAADFFNSFTVSVNATPETPVPETINLVGAFAIVGFCGYIWSRRSRALRCS